MSKFKSYREGSKANWGSDQEGALSIEQINCGALLRIADAVEKMASSWDNLRSARESAERSEAFYRDLAARRLRSITSYKGALTRAKRGRR